MSYPIVSNKSTTSYTPWPSAPGPINEIPIDVLRIIFSCFSIYELSQYERVSKKWQSICSSSPIVDLFKKTIFPEGFTLIHPFDITKSVQKNLKILWFNPKLGKQTFLIRTQGSLALRRCLHGMPALAWDRAWDVEWLKLTEGVLFDRPHSKPLTDLSKFFNVNTPSFTIDVVKCYPWGTISHIKRGELTLIVPLISNTHESRICLRFSAKIRNQQYAYTQVITITLSKNLETHEIYQDSNLATNNSVTFSYKPTTFLNCLEEKLKEYKLI